MGDWRDGLLPVGTRVRCLITDLGDGVVSGHILVDGPYRVRFDRCDYEDDPSDAHHRSERELRVLARPTPKEGRDGDV